MEHSPVRNVTHRPHDFYDLFRTLYPYLSLCQVFVSYFAYREEKNVGFSIAPLASKQLAYYV
jgi:hypothetical protein